MEFRLNKYNRNISDRALISDLKRISRKLNSRTVKRRDYDSMGKYSSSAFRDRFGSWNNAIKLAGLKPSKRFNITQKELFDNLLKVWLKLKRQPKCSEMKEPLSEFSIHVYIHKFGSFRKALVEFVKISGKLDKNSLQMPVIAIYENKNRKRKRKRAVNYALRYKVLNRDDYTCVKCGRSPATEKGVRLHIDHIKPYSKGGETVMKNLQTLCMECNIGKGNKSEKD